MDDKYSIRHLKHAAMRWLNYAPAINVDGVSLFDLFERIEKTTLGHMFFNNAGVHIGHVLDCQSDRIASLETQLKELQNKPVVIGVDLAADYINQLKAEGIVEAIDHSIDKENGMGSHKCTQCYQMFNGAQLRDYAEQLRSPSKGDKDE